MISLLIYIMSFMIPYLGYDIIFGIQTPNPHCMLIFPCSIPSKGGLKWTAWELNAILESNLVPSHCCKGQHHAVGWSALAL
jgi:hypothetical protein